MIQKIAVFCGSSAGNRPEYAQAARRLGECLGQSGRTLVFGGCLDGLMREVSQAALQSGGRIESEFIRGLYRESDHLPGAVEHIYDTLEERKAGLIGHSEACIALPGGMGTLDEFSELFARIQLGLPRRPLGLLNTLGYYDPLEAMLHRMLEEGFLSADWDGLVIIKSSPEELLSEMDRRMESYRRV